MKTKINVKLTVSLMVVWLLTFGSCSKDFLEQNPYGVLTTDSYFTTADQLSSSLNTAYKSLHSVEFDLWVLYDVGSDDAEKGGESESDQIAYQDISMSRQLAGNAFVSRFYNNLYAGIARCNLVIDKSAGITSSTARVAQMVNEAKFLRGYYYFLLCSNWGDVPLVTHFLTPSELKLAKSPASAIWQQIESDLLDATNLPTKSQWASGNVGRATSGAAWGMLGKVYMFQHKYADAEQALEKVVLSGQYSLVNDFGSIWRRTGHNNAESIFEVQHKALQTPAQGTNVVRSNQSRDLQARGWGFDMPTQDLLNEFEPGDPRIIYTFIFKGDVFPQKAAGQTYVVENSKSPTGYSGRKIFQIESLRDANIGDQGVNIRLLRYADVLLLYAEALNENGKPAQALTYLNMVRKRARNTPLTDPERISCVYNLTVTGVRLPDVTTTDKVLLSQAIWHERRCELAMESIRRYDLIRTGRFEVRLEAAKPIAQVELPKHLMLPLPQTEIDVTNGILVQNSDY